MSMHTESSTPNGNGSTNASTNGSAKSIEVRAPATGELIGTVPVMSPADVKKTVERARKAQEAWGLLPVEERAERLLKFRDVVVDRAEELVDVLTRETGKARQEALLHETVTLADLVTWTSKNAARILAPQEISLHLLKHRKSYVNYVPRGVVGIISPWNFPLIIPMTDTIAALVTGSAVVLKPSEVTPFIALKVKELWDATGLSEDLFQVVTGYGETGQALIDAGIQKLVFTGGVSTGKRVAAACGERLIPCVMELGGKAPLIACADADLERTARAIVFGGFANSGQVCVSVERVYAHESIHDRLLSRTLELVKELRQGDPGKSDVDVGAMIFGKQMDVADKHIEDALKKGATLKSGGKRAEGKGQFYPPTVLAGCDHSMTVMKEEIFGPIVPFMKVKDDEEALALANDSHLGLNAYVFTTDRDKGRRLAERVEAGSVLVNDVLSNYGTETPFGGVKQSGFGRVHGEDSLREMAEIRHVSVDRIPSPSRDPFWFPYTPKSYGWFLRGMRAVFSRGSIVQRISELF